jgi:hypothetical protein
LVSSAGLAATSYASATSSANFHDVDGEVFDQWGICRTRSFGEDGFYQVSETSFRPVIVFESLGEDADQAYELGRQMAATYPDTTQRAEAIFRFVQDRVVYTSDSDQFEYEEFAQNADELATTIDQEGITYGDCEDSAVLLAVMYKGAGYRSAIVVGPGHTAALVHLPEYDKATSVFKVEGEPGWLWAEATARNNPLGWVPKEFVNVQLAAYEVTAEAIDLPAPTTEPSVALTQNGGDTSSLPIPFFGIMALLWLMSLFRRRRAR